MLLTQATALQAIFIDLALRAKRQDRFEGIHTMTTLALKCAAQSRQAVTALAELRMPKIIPGRWWKMPELIWTPPLSMFERVADRSAAVRLTLSIGDIGYFHQIGPLDAFAADELAQVFTRAWGRFIAKRDHGSLHFGALDGLDDFSV